MLPLLLSLTSGPMSLNLCYNNQNATAWSRADETFLVHPMALFRYNALLQPWD